MLGKKSWNVYNQENIARVRRDEARAKLQEEEDEKYRQENDAEKRIQTLRGSEPAPSTQRDSTEKDEPREKRHGDARHRKRRKLAGENDTDRDIRFAKEDVADAEKLLQNNIMKRPVNDAPIMDESGHISLFSEKAPQDRGSEKNPEAEAETAKKNRELEDQYTMKFSNAAGYRQGMEAPWYKSSRQDVAEQSYGIPSKDVWGNEDPRRKEREKLRTESNDPLAAMRKGIRQLREVEQERKKWQQERDRDLQALKREGKEERRQHRDRPRRKRSNNSLDDFRLDNDAEGNEKRRRHRSHRHDSHDEAKHARRSQRDSGRHGSSSRRRHEHDRPRS